MHCTASRVRVGERYSLGPYCTYSRLNSYSLILLVAMVLQLFGLDHLY